MGRAGRTGESSSTSCRLGWRSSISPSASLIVATIASESAEGASRKTRIVATWGALGRLCSDATRGADAQAPGSQDARERLLDRVLAGAHVEQAPSGPRLVEDPGEHAGDVVARHLAAQRLLGQANPAG